MSRGDASGEGAITPAQVMTIHGEYCRLTDQVGLTLRYDRMRGWADWLRAGFTAEDLRLVTRYLRRGIATGARNQGALKWRNLIGQPDAFEEDLYEARRVMGARPARPTTEPRRQALPGGGERLIEARVEVDATSVAEEFARLRAERGLRPARE